MRDRCGEFGFPSRVPAPQHLEYTAYSHTQFVSRRTHAVTSDGKRLLVNTTGSDTVETPLTVVVNWLAAAT